MSPATDWLMQAALRATLLLAGLFATWKFLPASQPALRRKVLLGIAAGLLAAPWLSGWWSPGQASTAAVPAAAPDKAFPAAWSTLAAGLWLGGTTLALTRVLLEARALHQLIRRARPWGGSPALPHEITALQSSAISGPCVARGRKPVLLLPDSARTWTPSQWQMVIAHEQQHLRQQDLQLAWLPRLVHCFYWWHPLAHWLKRQFHAESEALCDRAALTHSGHSPREYVEFLLSLNAARMPAPVAGMALKSPLGQRIERLLPAGQRAGRRWAGGLALLILCGIAGFSFSLRTLPPDSTPGTPRAVVTEAGPVETPVDETALRLSANPFPEDGN